MKHKLKKEVLAIAIVSFCIVVLLSWTITETLTGEAFRPIQKINPPLKPIDVSILNGCYLQLNGIDYWLGILNKKDCESVYLALKYNSKEDFYRLLYSFNFYLTNSSELGKLNNGGTLTAKLLSPSATKNIFFREGNTKENFEYVEYLTSNPECQEISFFGVEIYCFNQVWQIPSPSETLSKKDNLKYIIPWLTILKYSNNLEVNNLLVGQNVLPFNFLVDNQIKYYDASQPIFYGETLYSVKCLESQGSANYQNKSGQSRVYVCLKMMNHTLNPQHSQYLFDASILFHEANHKFQQGHNYDVNCSKTNGGNTGDKDFKSVYGAHINYLFVSSTNPILSCGWRTYSFNTALEHMKTRLCQTPQAPSTGFVKPNC